MTGGRKTSRRSLLAPLLLVSLLGLLLGSKSPSPSQLRPGGVYDLDLQAGQPQTFKAHLDAGSLLHLEVEQNGLDVEIELSTTAGADWLEIDLPFGSRVRETVWLEAKGATDLEIRVVAGEGRGRPRLTVVTMGAGTPEERARARDFAAFWQPRGERGAVLRRLAAETKDPGLRMLALGMLGSAAVASGDSGAALAYLDEGQRLAAEQSALALAAQLQIWKAQALRLAGISEEVFEAFRQAAAAAQAANDPAAAGLAEAWLGNLSWQAGSSGDTIRHFAAARNYYAAAGYAQTARQQEINLARSLVRRGSSPEPLARLLRLLARQAERSGDETSLLLREIGWWLLLEERFADAVSLLSRAALLETRPVETLQRLAMAQLKLGDFAAARSSLRQAAASGATAPQRADIAISECLVELARGELEKLRESCAAASSTAGTGVDGLTRARLEQLNGRLEAAERYAVEEIEEIEHQRLRAGPPLERMDFLAVRIDSFELLAELRLALHARHPRAGWDRRALEAVEQTRARLLRDLLAEGAPETRSSARSLQARRQEEALRRKLAVLALGMLASLLHQGTADPGMARLLDLPLDQLDDLRQEATQGLSREIETGAAPSPPPDLAAVQRELDDGTALLVFHLGEKDAFGWVLTRASLRGVPLGDASRIRDLATALRGQIAEGSGAAGGRLPLWSEQLAAALYLPFARELETARQVVVVAPAELQEISFAALPYPVGSGRPLIASRRLANLPSTTVLPALRRRSGASPRGTKMLAVIDDPVYDDDARLPPELRRSGPFPPLPDTADEAELLLALVGDGSNLRLTGFEANRQRLMSGDILKPFRILHFAVHARTAEAPRGLVLSRYDTAGRAIEDAFGLAELSVLSLDADLVVTNACSSALGEKVAGEGWLGLSQGFLAAGIPRLLLTVRPVGGASARYFVGRFYSFLLSGLGPAEALRRTQLQMFNEGRDTSEWAAFALYGDWRPIPGLSSVADQHSVSGGVDERREDRAPK